MITIPVSVGELIDKLSILHVKQVKISDEKKLEYVNKEFELLYNLSSYYLNNEEVETLYHQLVKINTKLWDIEDKLRIIESEQNFDSEFIDLARKVYFTNDERFRLKNQINSISNDSLHDLELAKLQFISHKLAKTMHLLKASLVQEVLEGEAAEARINASGAIN